MDPNIGCDWRETSKAKNGTLAAGAGNSMTGVKEG